MCGVTVHKHVLDWVSTMRRRMPCDTRTDTCGLLCLDRVECEVRMSCADVSMGTCKGCMLSLHMFVYVGIVQLSSPMPIIMLYELLYHTTSALLCSRTATVTPTPAPAQDRDAASLAIELPPILTHHTHTHDVCRHIGPSMSRAEAGEVPTRHQRERHAC